MEIARRLAEIATTRSCTTIAAMARAVVEKNFTCNKWSHDVFQLLRDISTRIKFYRIRTSRNHQLSRDDLALTLR